MRASTIKIAALAGAAMLSISAAHAGSTLIPVPEFSGGSLTYAFGINDSNEIAGSYDDSNSVQHGFYGTIAGSYTSFDFSGKDVSATQARAVADNGDLTGYAVSSDKLIGYEWQMTGGTILTIGSGKKDKSLDGIAQQENASGTFTGSYENDKTFDEFGYLGSNGKLTSTLPDAFDSTAMAGRGIDDAGDVVGWFEDSSGVQHGLTYIGGTYTQVDYPGSDVAYTVLEGINDKGLIVGQYEDTSGVIHAFELNSKGTFTEIKVPDATSFVQAFGVNNAGFVTIVSDQGAFIYCPLKKAKCNKIGAAGIDAPEARSIHKPGGYFVAFNPKSLAKHGVLPPVKSLPKGAGAL
jgi:hypothetical protein